MTFLYLFQWLHTKITNDYCRIDSDNSDILSTICIKHNAYMWLTWSFSNQFPDMKSVLKTKFMVHKLFFFSFRIIPTLSFSLRISSKVDVMSTVHVCWLSIGLFFGWTSPSLVLSSAYFDLLPRVISLYKGLLLRAIC